MKVFFAFLLFAVLSASAFLPAAPLARTSGNAVRALNADPPKHKGSGGMADTRDPEPYEDKDPRKSIKVAPSFEEYMKQKAEKEAKK